MMKTILLANAFFYPHLGGVENSLYHIASELKGTGVNPIIMTSRRGLGDEELPSYGEIDGIPIYRFQCRKRKGPSALWSIAEEYRNSAALAEKIQREHPVWGLVARSHVCGLGAMRALPQAPSIYIPPGISKIQSSPSLLNNSGSLVRRGIRSLSAQMQLPVQHALQKCMLQKARRVLVFSEMMRRQIKEEFTFGATELLPPGVDHERFYFPLEREQNLRRIHGARSDDIVLLIVARINPSKGIDVVIKALRHLPSRFQLWVVGDGPEKERLQKLAGELELSNRTRFFASTQRPEEYYRAADVFLMSSKYEPFGQTILEAQASGLPVLGFRRDDSRGIATATEEIVVDGETGYLVPFGDEPLAQALELYAALPDELKQRLRKNSRDHVVRTYSWKNFCKRLMGKLEADHQKDSFETGPRQ